MSDLVKRVDVAKFFQVESEDVDRWIRRGLSVSRLPGKKRPSIRIYLPDLHEWLKKLGMFSDRLKSYEEFHKAFMAFRASRKGAVERSAA